MLLGAQRQPKGLGATTRGSRSEGHRAARAAGRGLQHFPQIAAACVYGHALQCASSWTQAIEHRICNNTHWNLMWVVSRVGLGARVGWIGQGREGRADNALPQQCWLDLGLGGVQRSAPARRLAPPARCTPCVHPMCVAVSHGEARRCRLPRVYCRAPRVYCRPLRVYCRPPRVYCLSRLPVQGAFCITLAWHAAPSPSAHVCPLFQSPRPVCAAPLRTPTFALGQCAAYSLSSQTLFAPAPGWAGPHCARASSSSEQCRVLAGLFNMPQAGSG